MKRTEATCRIEGVALSKIELIVGGAGDMSMKVRANLVDQDGEIHGTTERVGGWSEAVLESIGELAGSLESHLLAAHFDVSEESDGRSAERETPAGILDFELGSS